MMVRFDKWQALFDGDLFLASFIAGMAACLSAPALLARKQEAAPPGRNGPAWPMALKTGANSAPSKGLSRTFDAEVLL